MSESTDLAKEIVILAHTPKLLWSLVLAVVVVLVACVMADKVYTKLHPGSTKIVTPTQTNNGQNNQGTGENDGTMIQENH